MNSEPFAHLMRCYDYHREIASDGFIARAFFKACMPHYAQITTPMCQQLNRPISDLNGPKLGPSNRSLLLQPKCAFLLHPKIDSQNTKSILAFETRGAYFLLKRISGHKIQKRVQDFVHLAHDCPIAHQTLRERQRQIERERDRDRETETVRDR